MPYSEFSPFADRIIPGFVFGGIAGDFRRGFLVQVFLKICVHGWVSTQPPRYCFGFYEVRFGSGDWFLVLTGLEFHFLEGTFSSGEGHRE